MKKLFWVLFLGSCTGIESSDVSSVVQREEKAEPIAAVFRTNVSGLSGELILRSNGGEILSLSKDGTVEFPTHLLPNETYSLTVLEEPCAQRCTVDTPSGIVSAGGIVDVSVSCENKHWTFPTLSDSVSFSETETSNFDFSSKDLAMNRYGDMLVTWSQPDATGAARIYKKEFRNREWSGPSSISDFFTHGEDAIHHDVWLAEDGEAAISWIQGSTSLKKAYLGRRLENTWVFPTIAEEINQDGNVLIDDLTPIFVRFVSGGELVTVFREEPLAVVDRQLMRATMNQIHPLLPDVLSSMNPLDNDSTIEHVHMSMNQAGDYVVVWNQDDNASGSYASKPQIFFAEQRNGVWSPPNTISDDISFPGTSASYPWVAMNNSGQTVIVWHQEDDDDAKTSEKQIFRSVWENGVWTHPVSLSDNISVNGTDALFPRVAINDLGHVVIVWKHEPSSGYAQIYKMDGRFNASTGKFEWESAEKISPDGGEAHSAQVDIDENDNALIVWKQEAVGGTGVYHAYKSEYHPATGWTHPSSASDHVSPGSIAVVTSPSVVTNNCRAAMLWQQKDSADKVRVYKAEYR